jgi:hypothetical protein
MAAPTSPTVRTGALSAFEVEDVLLAACLLLAPWLGPETMVRSGGLTLLGWAVVAAFLVVFLSRGPADGDLDGAILRRMLVVGPFYLVLSIGAPLINGIRFLIRKSRARRLGIPVPPAPQGWPGPPLPPKLRRTLAVPFEIFGEGLFRAFCVSELDLWTAGAPLLERPFFYFLAFALIAAGYLALVIGPRVVAGAALDWRPWLLRFALYLGAALAGRLQPFAP